VKLELADKGILLEKSDSPDKIKKEGHVKI
jgi:hypothetical protein